MNKNFVSKLSYTNLLFCHFNHDFIIPHNVGYTFSVSSSLYIVESHCIVIECLQSNNNQEKCLKVTRFNFFIQSSPHPYALTHLAPDIFHV